MTYQESRLTSAARHPTLRRILAAALLLSSGGVLGSACADNESSLFIRSCLVWESETESCSVEPDPSGAFLTNGLVDAAFYAEYSCPLLIGNQLVRRGSSDQLRTETSRIELYEADVRVVDVGGAAIAYADGAAVEFTVPISGFVDPGTGSNPDYGVTVVPLLDGGSLQGLRGAAAAQGRAEVVALVTVRGRTLGGQEIETAEWPFPISVCNGCQCKSTIDPICCADPGNAACDGEEDLVTSLCSGDPYDCRLAGMTCSQIAGGP